MKRIVVLVGIILFCNAAYADEREKVIDLEPIVVTPWRIEESISDVSRNVTVITEKDIETSSAKDLPELIQDRSGVVVSDYYGNPKGVVVDIRGFGETSPSNVLVLIDGRRTNQVDLSGVDWGQIDIDAIESIEIVRGPSSVLYGDNATGGVINIITKSGVTKKPSVTIAGELGSYQYHKEYANISGIWQSKDEKLYTNYFLSASNQDTTGYRANNDYWASDYFGSLNLNLHEIFEVALTGGYHRDHYGMPGALYWNGNQWVLDPKGINQIGRRGTVFPDDRGFTSDGFATAEPRLNLLFGEQEVSLSFYSSFRERWSKGLNVPEANAWSARQEFETVHHIMSYELKPKLEFNLLWKGLDNSFIMGLDYFHAKDDVLSGDRINSQQDETDVYKETIGIYLHDNVKISEELIANAGGRIEWADYRFRQKRLIPNDESKKIDASAFNFGVGYKYNEKSQVYLDISKSYRFPNTEEFYQNKFLNAWVWPPQVQGGLNAGLAQQKAINLELGVKDVTFDWLSLNANLFAMETEHELYFDPSSYQNTNYENWTTRQGFELDAKLDLVNSIFKPFANLTLQRARFRDGKYSGNRIPFVPKVKFSTGITITPLDGLDWTTNLNYMGSRYKISDQKNLSPQLKEYTTVDTKLGYTYKWLNIWGAIRNIFDKKYFAYGVTNSTGSAETFYPAPERRLEAGMSLKF